MSWHKFYPSPSQSRSCQTSPSCIPGFACVCLQARMTQWDQLTTCEFCQQICSFRGWNFHKRKKESAAPNVTIWKNVYLLYLCLCWEECQQSFGAFTVVIVKRSKCTLFDSVWRRLQLILRGTKQTVVTSVIVEEHGYVKTVQCPKVQVQGMEHINRLSWEHGIRFRRRVGQ